MSEFIYGAMGLAIAAALVLTVGGVRQMRVPATRARGWLMIVAAAVLVMNAMIWIV